MVNQSHPFQTLSYRRPIALDLLAGAGGLSGGIEQAGFNVVCTIEQSPIHAAYKFHVLISAVLPADISQLIRAQTRISCE